MGKKKEAIRDPIELSWLFDKAYAANPKQPSTIMQSLQEAAPHVTPLVSAEERHQLREIILDTLSSLEEIEVWIINALLFEKMSLRDAGYVLSIPKTTLARKRDNILKKLQNDLAEHPLVKEHLHADFTN
mgnify:FL=1